MSNSVIQTIRATPPKPENLIAILHTLQDNHPQQYLTKEAVKEAAAYLNVTQGFVYGVVSYYSLFSLKPRGKYIVRVCVSPVCHMKGAFNLLKALQNELGVAPGETTPNGRFTLETSACLGRCGGAPTVMINRDYHTCRNSENTRQLLESYNEKP